MSRTEAGRVFQTHGPAMLKDQSDRNDQGPKWMYDVGPNSDQQSSSRKFRYGELLIAS